MRVAFFLVATAVVVLTVVRRGDAGLLDPEPPQPTPDDPLAAFVRPVSVIDVPMSIPLRPLLELVEREVPMLHGDLAEFRPRPDSSRAMVAYELERSAFQASFEGDVARLSALVFYRMRVRYALPALPDIESSCGMGDDLRPALFVALESPMSLDQDWSLRTKTRIADIRPASQEPDDRCTITVLNIDITDDVLEGARAYLEEHLSEIDSLVARVDTQSRFESWWNTLSEPIELGDSVWLAIRPEAIRRGPLRGSGDSVTVDLALRSRPEIVIGAPAESRTIPLPELDSGEVTPGLELLVDGRADYETASRLLSELVKGQTIVMEGRVVRLESIRVYGIGGGRLAMEVGVSGDLRGRLYLTGRPAIDRATGRVSLPDLELDVATRNILLSTASWFAVRVFREELRERATWPMTSAVTWLTYWLDQGLNRNISNELGVTGVVDTVEIMDVAAFREALLVRMSARGSASMYVRN